MLPYTVTFLVIAVAAAFLGFGLLAGLAAGVAKILFLCFLVLFILSVVFQGQAPR
jgi:uncharacterized membrane protein YtjA (UPF0391 family)